MKKNKVNLEHYNVGDNVSIIRHRHGWADGSITGRVSKVNFRIGGAAHYVVKDKNGTEYEIRATKDLHAI